MGKSSKNLGFRFGRHGPSNDLGLRVTTQKNPSRGHYGPAAALLPSAGVAGPPHAVKY
jgi:hypothetical protein